MEVTRAVAFMNLFVGLLFFAINNSLSFLLSTVNIYYHKSHIRYTINPIGKSDKNDSDKKEKNRYLINKALDKFNRTLSRQIIRNNKAFLMHHMLGYLKQLRDDYGIKPVFTHPVILKIELLKKFEN